MLLIGALLTVALCAPSWASPPAGAGLVEIETESADGIDLDDSGEHLHPSPGLNTPRTICCARSGPGPTHALLASATNPRASPGRAVRRN